MILKIGHVWASTGILCTGKRYYNDVKLLKKIVDCNTAFEIKIFSVLKDGDIDDLKHLTVMKKYSFKTYI